MRRSVLIGLTAALTTALAAAEEGEDRGAVDRARSDRVDAGRPETPAYKATTGASREPEKYSLPPLDVVDHYENAVGTTDASSQGTVNGQLLQELPLLRPGEALETVPGLVVTQHSGDGKANQYFLRGYNLDHGTDFSIKVDGVPVNMPTNAHGQGYSDVNFLIPELVERINYRKGPYFSENGDFSAAGAADIRYRSVLDHDIADLTAGSFGYRRAVFAGSRSLDAMGDGRDPGAASANSGPSLLGGLEIMRNDGPWSSPEDFHKLNGLARLSDGDQAGGWSIDTVLYDAHWNSTDQVPLQLINSGQLGRFSALDPTDGGETGRALLSGEWHRLDDTGFTRAQAFVEHYRLKLWSNFTFFELRPATGDQFLQAESRNIVGGQVVRGWNHALLGHESTTEVGLQVRHDNIDVSLKNTEARIPFQTVSDDRVSETSTGLYLQNTASWTRWLRTLIGAREDAVIMDKTAYVLPQNSGNVHGNIASPKLSVIFGPWAKTEFFVNAGRGFHSNDARGAIDKIDPTTGAASTPVPALVGATGKEIGMRTEIVPGLQSSIAVWSLDSKSEIIYSADSAIGSTQPNGASKRTGVEWNNHWVAAPWLLVDGDLAWTHARYASMNDNGQLGDYIANAVGKVGLLSATIPHLGPWSAGVEARYIGRYPLSQDGSLMAQSSLVTNLRLQRDFTPKVSLSVDVLNLFDRKYFDVEYQQDYQVSRNAPVVPSGVTVHPGEPREFRVALKIKF